MCSMYVGPDIVTPRGFQAALQITAGTAHACLIHKVAKSIKHALIVVMSYFMHWHCRVESCTRGE